MKAVVPILMPALAALLMLGPAVPRARGAERPDRYQECLDRLTQDPNGALEDAEAWEEEGGGAAAGHCAGLALSALKRYDEAARRFAMLAKDPHTGDAAERAQLYAQAGNAWLLGKRPSTAYEVLSQSLALAPNDLDVRFDRARAAVLAHDFRHAKGDLDKILTTLPYDTDALVLRATVRREDGDLSGAFEDADLAVRLAPDMPEALIERGLVRHAQGDRQGAVADWRRVLDKNAPKAAKSAAQRLIQEDALKTPIDPAEKR